MLSIASVWTLVAYYTIALPIAALLGFYFVMGIKGFWIGFIVGLLFLNVNIAVLCYKA